mmetsp:Transcript_52834/g.150635  ORF Transcript_52834/g.150635 Transcript_52834/m.150635 type:complete len:275 (+) Transcript_52834:340-1164(+)
MQCCREMIGSCITRSLALSFPMLKMGEAALRSFSAGRSVFMGESRQIADSTIFGFSSRFTLASFLPQWQCMSTRWSNRVARFTCSAEPRTFTCASSGAHSTSAPLCSVSSCRCSGVMRYSTRSFGTGTARLGRSRLSLEKSIGVVSTRGCTSMSFLPGIPGIPGGMPMPGGGMPMPMPGAPLPGPLPPGGGVEVDTPGNSPLFAASMASSWISAEGPSSEVSLKPTARWRLAPPESSESRSESLAALTPRFIAAARQRRAPLSQWRPGPSLRPP